MEKVKCFWRHLHQACFEDPPLAKHISARRTTSNDLLGLSFPTHGKTRCLCTTFYTEELGVHQALHSPKVTPGDVGSIEFDLHQISNTDLPGRKSKPVTYEQSRLLYFSTWET